MPELRTGAADRAGGDGLITIVVLSYDRPELLDKALRSIARQSYRPCEVLVIDNASPSSARVRDVAASFPAVRLIANAVNLGFTGGMNQGIAEASGEFVYLTEDDVELDDDCVERLVAYLRAHPDAGLAGPVMWNRRTGTIRCAGGTFRLGTVHRMHVNGAGEAGLSESEPFETMYLPGAAIAARTAFLRELGGFHPDFFMYGEDVELCARVLEHRRSIAVVPAARVHHHEPPPPADSAILAYHKQKNFVALYVLHAPLRVLPGFFIRYGCIDGLRRLLRDRSTVPVWISAWCFTLRRCGRLLMQRRSRVCSTC